MENKKIKKENYIGVFVILLFTGIFLFYIWFLGENVLDPGDGIKHFQIAKYSWKYPHLFFDHWGKPLFTLLSSPFAQFGFKGMIVFNVLLFIITAVFLLKITKELSLKYGWVAVLFCLVAPVYFRIVLSGLTEILFATIIIATLYFFIKQKYFYGCLLLSFSIFSRPEAYMIIPCYALYLILKKELKYIPILAVGFILYSIIGWYSHNDLLWVITKRPYSLGGSIYGSGDLLHFISSYKVTFGTAASFFSLIGIGLIVFNLFKKKFINIKKEAIWVFLILLPIISVIGGHSLLWWMGKQGSAGLLRVLTTIIPFVALLALYAISNGNDFILKNIRGIKKDYILFSLIILGVFLTYRRVRVLEMDERMISTEKVLLEAANWYTQNMKDKNIYYIPPYFAYQADIDPFSEKRNIENMKNFKDKITPSNNMKNGELILWEGQFSELEGGMPLINLLNDKKLVRLKRFFPNEKNVFYGKQYEAHFFIK